MNLSAELEKKTKAKRSVNEIDPMSIKCEDIEEKIKLGCYLHASQDRGWAKVAINYLQLADPRFKDGGKKFTEQDAREIWEKWGGNG